jgi:hypothetical protein
MNWIRNLLGQTFLVNLHTGEVHNTKNEKKNCNLHLISKHHKKYVTKKQAMHLISLNHGFNGCRWCMPKEDSDKW